MSDFIANDSPVWRSIKATVTFGTWNGMPAVRKCIVSPQTIWHWYFHREVALYQLAAQTPLPVRIPRVFAWDLNAFALVLEHVPGAPITPFRRTRSLVSTHVLEALLHGIHAVQSWPRANELTSTPPHATDVAALRSRILEDPSAPRAWFHQGIDRGVERGILTPNEAHTLHQALHAHDAIAFSHGDLLLRNVMLHHNTPVWIDWECAGMHPRFWDYALVWVCLVPEQRAHVEQYVMTTHPGPAQHAAFWASVAFALVREIKFRQRNARKDTETLTRESELQTALMEVRRWGT